MYYDRNTLIGIKGGGVKLELKAADFLGGEITAHGTFFDPFARPEIQDDGNVSLA